MFQRRQGRFGGSERGSLCGDYALRNGTSLKAQFEESQNFFLRIDNFMRRLDLVAQRGFLYSGRHDIRCQAQINRFFFKTAFVGLSLQSFNGPARAAEKIKPVCNADRGVIQAIGQAGGKAAKGCARGFLPLGREVGAYGWEQFRIASGEIVLRNTQRRFGRGQIGIILKRLRHQPVQIVGMK